MKTLIRKNQLSASVKFCYGKLCQASETKFLTFLFNKVDDKMVIQRKEEKHVETSLSKEGNDRMFYPEG